MQKPREEVQTLVNAIEKLHKEARADRFLLASVSLDQLTTMRNQIYAIQSFVWDHTEGAPLPK